jgi:hypothetical protein
VWVVAEEAATKIEIVVFVVQSRATPAMNECSQRRRVLHEYQTTGRPDDCEPRMQQVPLRFIRIRRISQSDPRVMLLAAQ